MLLLPVRTCYLSERKVLLLIWKTNHTTFHKQLIIRCKNVISSEREEESRNMSFWGVKVSNTPYIHPSGEFKRRLRLTQATLEKGGDTCGKSIYLQCHVGTKPPILLCSLIPNKVESCKLDFEFEEKCSVMFSVIGPRSIYISGYLIPKTDNSRRHENSTSDTESHGIDIQYNSDDNIEYGEDDDDEYEDSFIDDSELPVSNIKCNRKSKTKTYQYLKSDEDKSSSDDESGYLFSIFNKEKFIKSSNDKSHSDDVFKDDSFDEGILPLAKKTRTSEISKKKSSAIEISSEDDSSSSSSSSSSEEEDDQPHLMIDLKEKGYTTTIEEQKNGSKSLYVGNLPFAVKQSDVEEFFKSVESARDVCFSINSQNLWRGYAHVEFSSIDAANKALKELNGKVLLGRPVTLAFARKKGSYNEPCVSSKFEKLRQRRAKTIFLNQGGIRVKGRKTNI